MDQVPIIPELNEKLKKKALEAKANAEWDSLGDRSVIHIGSMMFRVKSKKEKKKELVLRMLKGAVKDDQ